MTKNMLQLVKDTLRKDDRLCSGERFLRNKVMELTHKQDEGLIDLLLNNDKIKEHFFTEVNGTLVFDKDEFIKFVNNKQFLPDSYTMFKNKIGLTSDGEYLEKKKDVALAWPYKDCVLEGDQADPDEDRDEVFWNEILAPDEVDRLLDPKVLTNFMRIDEEGEHSNPEIKSNDNLIVRGNNLLALHSIKQKFRGKIKLIYIDPIWNRDTDSFYNDSFKHSTWCTFMKNRLEIAKEELLAPDSLIFAHIDDIEQAYLKVIMDEIFGRENFVTTIAVRSSTASGLKTAHREKTIIKQKDFILVYKKGNPRFYPQYIEKGEWDTHYNYFFDKENEEILKLRNVLKKKGLLGENETLNDLNIKRKEVKDFYKKHADAIFQTAPEMPSDIKKKSNNNPDKIIEYGDENNPQYAINGRRMTFLSSTLKKTETGDKDLANLLCDIWTDIDFQNTQNEGGVDFPAGEKPEKLIFRIINLATSEDDIVLDFFLGSGTTAAVAHKMGRRYIGIEQLDYGKNGPVQRLKNVINGDESGISDIVDWDGGGSFVYCELMEWNQRYFDRIEEADNEEELLKIWKEMKEEAFLSYEVDPKKFGENVDEFKELGLKDQKKFLMECLDKNHLHVNLSEIDDEEYGVSEEDKRLNRQFYEGF